MADDSIRVEYNQDLQPLEELLEGVERAGDFFANGALEIPMPKVEVAGIGVLSFPVPPAQIAALVQQATRAPYGRGEKTILDESVRKVWQLPPDKVRVGGKSWAVSFDGILKRVIAGLGCEGRAVSAELYKLLVYDTGGFFLTHRDTEKADGMFATLVVALPSAHRGGELAIRHAGREVTIDLSNAEVSEVSFAAFYADCEHEVRPITEGNRVCLVYNLIQGRVTKKAERGWVEDQPQRGKTSRASKKGGALPRVEEDTAALQAPDYEREITAAAELLDKHLTESDAPAKIAWLLEHQYSPDGLSFTGLKSADAARVKVLAQAAARVDCAAHLGIVHIEESGSANPTGFDYRPRRWGRYRDYDEGEESSSSEDFEVIEVCDWRHYVSQWRDLRDLPIEFGEIPLEPGELLPVDALDDEKPDEQRLMEASGNEGASFERSYHRAALVIWRRERYAEVLLQAGVAAALPYLKERIEACGEKNSPAARKEAAALALRLVNAWKGAPEYPGFRQPGRPEKRDIMLRLLIDLGDAALLETFIANVVTRDYDGSDNAALVAGASLLGAEKSGRLFAELVHRHMRHLHGACVDLLHSLVSKRKPSTNPEWQTASREMAEAAVSKLDEIGKKQRDDEWVDWRISEKAWPTNVALVVKLLDALGKLDAAVLRAGAVEKFAARPAVFDPVSILVPALGSLHDWDAPMKRLWEHSTEFLLNRSGRPPESPKDWRQDVKLSCSCADCRELQAFTIDPTDQTRRFRVRQDRRQHLHQQIEQHGLDMTHVTERKGSPQTLVCTKDRRSYERRCEQYRKDIAALKALAERGHKTDVAVSLLERIETARALADEWSPALTDLNLKL